ncbi:MAG: diguanylate cyclase, partial [Acidobacteria bacterium]|nr:diguanylate cyclase [Acidobacteriota bacterium]
MTVLIADDSPPNRLLLERAVQSFGYQTVSAGDGEQAWQLFSGGDFSFVITDWIMPGMDGLELCRRIRAAACSHYVYIIMATSRSGREDLLEAMDAGADDFIVKPIDRRELQVRMRAAQRILKLQAELRLTNEQLEVMNGRLSRLSRLDSLTQLGNRLAFEERISEFHQRAVRYGNKYGVIMCDVDHFKAYNDQHGHLAGDEALRQVSAAMKSSLRGSDGAFRYGGEEIVALLPEQTFQDTLHTAERLRSTVESLQLPHKGNSTGVVTLSCGVAACPLDGETPPNW